MRMLMIGAGGVGGVFGAKLAWAGQPITFVARGEHARAMRERGITLTTPRGSHTTPALDVRALSEVEGPFDVILISVKWSALEEVCAELPRLLSPHGVVVPLLNGVESEDVVARYVGAQRTLAAVAYVSAALTGPGQIALTGHARVGLAPFREGQLGDIDRVANVLGAADVPVRRADSPGALLWEKMVWNAPLNAICALTERTAGWVVDHLEALVREAMQEVIAVAQAEGVALPAGLIDLMLHVTRSEFPETEPSMLQDVRAGRATEVDILQGAVVRRAAAHGLAVPIHRTLEGLLRGRTGQTATATAPRSA